MGWYEGEMGQQPEGGKTLSSHHIWTFIPSVCPPVCPFVHSSVRPFIRSSVRLFVRLPLHSTWTRSKDATPNILRVKLGISECIPSLFYTQWNSKYIQLNSEYTQLNSEYTQLNSEYTQQLGVYSVEFGVHSVELRVKLVELEVQLVELRIHSEFMLRYTRDKCRVERKEVLGKKEDVRVCCKVPCERNSF
jgi:hypothetical protein